MWGRPFSDRRESGQIAVLGIVLLIGVVAIASIGVLLVAGQSTTTIKQETENDRVEQAFVELSKELETASASQDVSRTMTFALDEERGAIHREAAGELDVKVDGTSVLEGGIPIDALLYETDDGTTISYQSGAVFRGTGDESRLISAPSVFYRDGSLDLPVTRFEHGSEVTSGDVSMTGTASEVYFSQHIGHEEVTVEITTQYYEGWKTYFETQIDETEAEVVDESRGYDGAKTVVVKLGGGEGKYLGHEVESGIYSGGVFEAGGNQVSLESDIVAQDVECNGGGGNEAGECPQHDETRYDLATHDGVELASVDDEIDSLVDTARARTSAENGTAFGQLRGDEGPLTEELYFAESTHFGQNEQLTVDLSANDVTLVVDGNIGGTNKGGFSIENADAGNTFRVYTTGSVDWQSMTACVDGCDGKNAEAFQLYATSDHEVKIMAGSVFEGFVYNPEETVRVHGQHTEFHGAVIAEHVRVMGNGDFYYDPGTKGTKTIVPNFESDVSSAEIVYLNVNVNDVDVADS